MKLVNQAANALANLLLLLLAVYSLIYLGIHAFALDYHLNLIPAALTLCCLLAWVFFTFRRSRLLLAAVLAGASALSLWNRGGDFWNQAAESVEAVISQAASCYARAYEWADFDLAPLNGDSTPCLLLLGGLLALFFGWALISMERHPLWALGGSALLFAPAAAVHGYPKFLPMAGLLAFWALLLLSAALRRQREPGAGLLTLGLTPLVGLLLALGLNVLQPADYQPNPHLHAFADRAAELWEETVSSVYSNQEAQSPEQTPQETASTALPPETRPEAPSWRADQAAEDRRGQGTSIDLTELGPLRQSSLAIMRVNSDLPGTTYLRGISMGDYTGSTWEPAEPRINQWTCTAGNAALEAGGQMGHMQVHMLTYSAISYLPYYYVCEPGLRLNDVSVRLTDEDREERDFVFYDGPLSALPPRTGNPDFSETAYEEHVREAYTQLPDSTRSALLQLAEEAGLTSGGADLIEQVAAYIQNAAVYETEMEPFPEEADFAVYFLTEAREGYCVHFATAATALYRALGIPARLVSGFVFEAKAGEWVNVTGRNAHAWVEVYLERVGWVPVEVTGIVGGEPLVEDREDETQKPAETPEPEMEKTAPPAWIEPVLKALSMALGLMAAVGLIVLRRRLTLAWRTRRFGASDPGRAAVRLRQYARRLERRGVPFPETLEELAQRACFGNRPVTEAELAPCRAQVEAGVQAILQTAPGWKRLWLRYGPCLA